MLIILKIICWFFVFSGVIWVIIKRKIVSLNPAQILLAYGFQVLLGCLHGYIYMKYYPGDDTVYFNQYSYEQYQLLINHPADFFSQISFTKTFRENPNFALGWHYLLDELQMWLIVKPLAFFNAISQGSYYLNVVFFSFISFWGPYLLYKLFASIQPQKKTIFFLACFFIPQIGFWSDGIRSDGLLMVSLAMVLYYFNCLLARWSAGHFLLFIIGLLGMLILRDELLLLLIPSLLSWWLIQKFGYKPWKVLTIVYSIAVILFFISGAARMVAERQHEFLALKGSSFRLDPLEPTVSSFLRVLPQAVLNGFVRPFPWEANGLLQWAMVADIFFFLVLSLFAVVNWKRIASHPLILPILGFAILALLFIGYTVPFPGAIVRYKIISEILLYIVFLSPFQTHYKKI